MASSAASRRDVTSSRRASICSGPDVPRSWPPPTPRWPRRWGSHVGEVGHVDRRSRLAQQSGLDADDVAQHVAHGPAGQAGRRVPLPARRAGHRRRRAARYSSRSRSTAASLSTKVGMAPTVASARPAACPWACLCPAAPPVVGVGRSVGTDPVRPLNLGSVRADDHVRRLPGCGRRIRGGDGVQTTRLDLSRSWSAAPDRRSSTSCRPSSATTPSTRSSGSARWS